MRSDIYCRIVFLIDEYRTWVKVDNANHYEVCSVKLDERQFPCVCFALHVPLPTLPQGNHLANPGNGT